MTPTTPRVEFPAEIWLHVCQFLQSVDVAALAQVSIGFHGNLQKEVCLTAICDGNTDIITRSAATGNLATLQRIASHGADMNKIYSVDAPQHLKDWMKNAAGVGQQDSRRARCRGRALESLLRDALAPRREGRALRYCPVAPGAALGRHGNAGEVSVSVYSLRYLSGSRDSPLDGASRTGLDAPYTLPSATTKYPSPAYYFPAALRLEA
ncbi:hypothetical protein CSAL01_13005 [Colletotrichum salicis]|uniref:F-box domain-containing protein n=1 Tax=Colletotrichum salicis TaxID=1209931 RepID=A0A135V8J4_9PEZI|nr:hypothetical protein CSAL01_13005 [Colletotrichum salicis]